MDKSNFPNSFNRGDTVSLKDYFDEYQPIAGWICDYIFINNTHKVVLKNNTDIISNISTNHYDINLDSNKTMIFNASTYQMNIKFTNTITNKVKTITLDKINVKENLEFVNRAEIETLAEKGLRIVNEYLSDSSNPRVQSYEIDGRRITNFSHEELENKKYFFENEVKKEKAKKNKVVHNNNIIHTHIRYRY